MLALERARPSRRVGAPSRWLAWICALTGIAAGAQAAVAEGASWHLDSAFGLHGVAGVPVREEGIDFPYPPGPGAQGSLLAAGPRGSVFVGGFADHQKGSFRVARLSAGGRLVKGFGSGGVSVVPTIHATAQRPPRMLALAGGGLLIVGLDRAGRLAVVRLSPGGAPDRSFGRDGVADYALADSAGHAIVAAAAVESDGSILIAYYRKEVAEPVNEPQVAPGFGAGPLQLVRLLGSGSLDAAFGKGGFLEPPLPSEGAAAGVTIDAEGSILIAYEQTPVLSAGVTEAPAVQELTASGVPAPGFGKEGVATLPFLPSAEGVSSSIFGALFALAGGSVEVSFGGEGEVFRFTSSGALDSTFGTSGHARAGRAAAALALAPDEETFALNTRGGLTLAGTLANGAPDPTLGGRSGMRLPAHVPGPKPGEERQAVQLLAGNAGLRILVGEEIVALTS